MHAGSNALFLNYIQEFCSVITSQEDSAPIYRFIVDGYIFTVTIL